MSKAGKVAILAAGIAAIALNTSFISPNYLHKYNLESGVNITSFKNAHFGEEERLAIDYLANQGFSGIALNPVYVQQGRRSSSIGTTSGFSIGHIDSLSLYALGRGLDVVLKPLVNTLNQGSRAKIMPDSIDAWFEDYTSIMLSLSEIAKRRDVQAMVIGCELDGLLIKHPERFERLAQDIRAAGYSGNLIYSMEFLSEKDLGKIAVLNRLPIDAIGIDFYVGMKEQQPKNKSDAGNEHAYYLRRIQELSEKPIVISEIGYRSVAAGNKWPMFNNSRKGRQDQALQEESYFKFISAITSGAIDLEKLSGVYFWITDNSHYPQDILFRQPLDSIGYSFFGKKAQGTVSQFNKARLWIKYPAQNAQK